MMRSRSLFIKIAFMLLVGLLSIIIVKTDSYAASFKPVAVQKNGDGYIYYSMPKKPTKVYSYYFKYKAKGNLITLFYGKKKNKLSSSVKFKNYNGEEIALTDGKSLIYIDEKSDLKRYITQFDLKTKKKKILSKLSFFSDEGTNINGVYDGYIFFSHDVEDSYFCQEVYDVKKKKTWTISGGDKEVVRFDLFAKKAYVGDKKISLNKGIKIIKLMEKYNPDPSNDSYYGSDLIGNKYYYYYYDKGKNIIGINRYDLKTGKNKQLGKIKAKKDFSLVEFVDGNGKRSSKSCSVYMNQSTYEYTYKTKKLVKLEQDW